MRSIEFRALDSIRPAYIYRHGQAYYYETFGGTRNVGVILRHMRHPRNDTDFWTIQESSIAGLLLNWDTWWAKVRSALNRLLRLFYSVSVCVGIPVLIMLLRSPVLLPMFGPYPEQGGAEQQVP